MVRQRISLLIVLPLALAFGACASDTKTDDSSDTDAGFDTGAFDTGGPGRDTGRPPTDTGGPGTDTGRPDTIVPPPSCGDGVVDPGEQCDDGGRVADDGCDADCQDEVAEPGDWDGVFDGDPNLGLLICGLFDISITQWDMSSNGQQLTLLGSPGYPDIFGGGAEPMQFTGQVPAGVDFTVVNRVVGDGLCTEEYTVDGSFDDDDNWSGTFHARFIGNLCGLAGCVALDRPVGGTRR